MKYRPYDDNLENSKARLYVMYNKENGNFSYLVSFVQLYGEKNEKNSLVENIVDNATYQ